MDKSTKECCEECFKWGEHYGEYVHPCHNPECECHKKVTMDKNKWIEAKVKRFDMEFLIERITKVDVSDEKEFTYVARPTDLKGYEAKQALESFLRQSLEECWSKAQDDYHELEIITEHRSLDEALKPEHIDIKPLLDCKPEKTLLIQSK